MSFPKKLLIGGMAAWLIASGAAPAKSPEPKANAAVLQGLDGKTVDPFAKPQGRFVAFLFVRVDCPIANRYTPEIQRLQKAYEGKGVAFRLVYCDPDESVKAIRKHLGDFGYKIEAYRDPTRKFAKRSRVEVTPEAAVYRADGDLLYHGRIDDRVADYGKIRNQPERRDLVLALDAALAGKKVPAAGGKAIGCYIEPAE